MELRPREIGFPAANPLIGLHSRVESGRCSQSTCEDAPLDRQTSA